MVSSVRIAFTDFATFVAMGIKPRTAHWIGADPARSGHHCAAFFSFAVMGLLSTLSACAKVSASELRQALPTQRNIVSLAPTPCTIPNTGQTDTPNVLNRPQPSDIDRLRVDCLRGVPPLRTTWSWSGPAWEEPPDVAAARARAEKEREGLREAAKAFERRKRAGR